MAVEVISGSPVTLSYKGNTILELDDSATKSIKTAGKYLEDNIVLTYVDPGGGTVEPDLPNEYQRVEYLGITKSSAYFPISFSPIEINDRIEVEVMDTATTTSEQGFVGGSSFPISFSPIEINDRIEVEVMDTATTTSEQGLVGTSISGGEWEIFFESGNIKFYGDVTGTSESYEKNEKQTIRGRFTQRYTTSSFNFGFYSGQYFFTGRLYGLRIYNGRSGYDKTITWCKLVPCYLKSDNTPGFYDLVNSVFYTKTGSGAVEIGPDVN